LTKTLPGQSESVAKVLSVPIRPPFGRVRNIHAFTGLTDLFMREC